MKHLPFGRSEDIPPPPDLLPGAKRGGSRFSKSLHDFNVDFTLKGKSILRLVGINCFAFGSETDIRLFATCFDGVCYAFVRDRQQGTSDEI